MKLSSRIVFPALLALSIILAPVLVRTQAGRGGARDRERVEGREVAAGEVLVRFRTDAANGREDARRDVDADDDRPVGQTGWRRMHSASRSVQAMMLALARRADVLQVEPNYIVHTTLAPNDPFFPSLWGLKNNSVAGADIHATAAWDVSTGSAANVVGIVDTGVDYAHPDLAANMWSAPSQFTVTVAGQAVTCPAGSHGFNAIAFFQREPNAAVCNPADDYFHGTHVAGTVGAAGNNGAGVAGVNWTTRLMALKFLDSTGSGSIGDAINAIDFAIQVKNYFAASKGANVRVLSNSYGGDGLSPALSAAIARANTADMLFVAAAGNAGTNNDATPFYPASDSGPNVVAVAATDENDGRAGFSNYGATSVDLGAPGTNILSTLPGGGYGGASGTSMATPQVAGAAALVLSGCNLSTAQLKAALLDSVDPVAALTGITATGGRLDVDRALRSCATLPTVAVTSPPEGASYFAPASIALAVSASDPDGIARVEFYAGATLVGTSLTSPYGGSWTNVAAGSYTLTAKAYDSLGLATVSAPVHVTVTAPGGTSASFLGTDLATQGNWRGTYGTDGYVVVNDASNLPAYASVTPSGEANWTFANPTSDGRGLERAAGGGRLAAAWYGSVFSVDVNLTDGQAHTLTMYAVDWDTTERGQVFEIRDASTGVLLDSQTVTNFHAGQYWRWTVRGHVTVRATRTSGWNALISGVFLDTAGAPAVSLTSPGEGATFTAPASIALSATASDADGIARVEFYQGTTLVGTSTTSPYGGSWTNVAAGSYTLTAKAYDSLGLATVSAPVHVTVTAPGGASASFLGTDLATQGNWRGTYGTDGYVVVNDASNLPAYASVTPSGEANWTFANATSDGRGLERAAGGGRLAAAWYGSVFSVDVNLTDGQAHTLTMYAVDWDTTERGQVFEIRDASTGVLLDSQTVTNFHAGQYWRWTVRGHVTVRATRTSGWNALISGVFLDAAGAPAVSLTSPGEGATFTAPASIALSATASDPDGIARVEFYQGTTLVGTSTTSPYGGSWTNVAAGSYTLTAKAYDSLGLATVSAPVHVTVTAPGGTSASFLGTDLATQGNWRGTYGTDGYVVVNDASNLPAYASVTPSGEANWTFANPTSDGRGLERAAGGGRLAAAWYGSVFSVDVNLTDGQAHTLTMYAVDWDTTERGQVFEIRDALTGALLDSQTVTNFHAGQYWRWTVRGHVTVRATRTSGWNALISGVFLDTAGAPAVSLTSPGEGATFTAPASIALSATASDPDGIARVEFYQGTTLVGTSTTSPYGGSWTNVAAGSYTLTAKAYDSLGLATVSAPVHVTVTAPGGTSASFLGTDLATQGNWRGTYGTDGYVVVNDASNLPAYASVTPSGEANWTFANPTSDGRGLERAAGGGRLAAAWYGSVFSVDVNLTDGQAHTLTMYAVDWDTTERGQVFEIRDALTGALLDSQTVTNFHAGQYWRWTVRGHVTVRATRTSGWNALISGVFLDTAGAH